MSAEDILNQPTAEVERAPSQDFTPMPELEEPKKKTYSDDIDGVKAASREVAERREAAAPPPALETDEQGIVRREYKRIADGSDIPLSETVTPERAAADLTAVREADIAAQSPMVGEVQTAIDHVRDQYVQGQLGIEQQQPEAQQTQPQVEQPQVEGVHPDVVAALQNENVRNALAAEVAQVEQARAAYAQQAHAAAQVSAASVLANFPELANVPNAHLQTAIAVIGQSNPQRAHAINEALARTQALYNASQQAQAQQRQMQDQQIHRYVQQQDEIFEKQILAKEDPATVARVRENIVDIAKKEFGVSKAELAQLWHSSPLVRSAPFQHMMYTAAKHALAERSIANKLDRSVPPVVRPGVSQPHGSNDGDVADALKKFNSDPTPKNAADLLIARRAARR
jgi:hypothetical protein